MITAKRKKKKKEKCNWTIRELQGLDIFHRQTQPYLKQPSKNTDNKQ